MSTGIRPARPDDAAGIVTVIRGGFAPDFQETMIYGCAGVADYVWHLVAVPEVLAESRFTVAVADEQIVGAVELREVGPVLVLNYIAVDAAHRAGGLARRLLRTATEAAASPDTEAMQLDVLAGNATARTWYERLGFEAQHETAWWHATTAGRPRAAGARVRGVPQAEAAHARFGFSHLDVVTPRATVGVGRLGARWFRLTDPDALADPAFIDALVRLDPARDVLALLPPAPAPAGCTRRATTVRMCVSMPHLAERLRLGALLSDSPA